MSLLTVRTLPVCRWPPGALRGYLGHVTDYGEGERVFGPPLGSYDADWVASAARSRDPGLPAELARELSVRAWQLLREIGRLDAAELARRLLSEHPEDGATPANVVARAAVDFCEAYAVTP